MSPLPFDFSAAQDPAALELALASAAAAAASSSSSTSAADAGVVVAPDLLDVGDSAVVGVGQSGGGEEVDYDFVVQDGF